MCVVASVVCYFQDICIHVVTCRLFSYDTFVGSIMFDPHSTNRTLRYAENSFG